MTSRGAGDEARLIAAALQAFEEAGADFEPVLDHVCRLACELTGDPWTIRLVEDDGTLRLAGSAAPDAETLADLRSTVGGIRPSYAESRLADVWAEDCRAVHITTGVLQLGRDRAQPEIVALAERRGFVGGLLAPMRVRGKVIGVLWSPCQQHRGVHDDADVDLAGTLADRCALAIENARLQANIEAERNRHAALLAHVTDAVVVVDAAGIVTYVTPGGVTRVLGWEPEDLLGSNVFDLVHRKDHQAALEGFLRTLGPDDRPPLVVRARHRDGTWRHLFVSANNLLDDPAVGGVVITATDVTERVVAAQLLTAENEILELVATGAPLEQTLNAVCQMVDSNIRMVLSSIWLIDESTGELVAAAMQGVETLRLRSQGRAGAQYARNMPDSVLVSDPETEPLWAAYRDEARSAGIGCSWTRSISSADGQALGALIIYRRDLRAPDEMERQVIELAARLAGVAVHRANDADRLAHAATHDTVTGLPNRRLFLDRLREAVDRQRRGARPPAVLFIDLDRFKQVNDRAGHAAGDEVLRLLGARLERVVRPTDVVARFGGDEFAVLCDEMSEHDALTVAERLLAAICEPVELSGLRHHVSGSIGIAAGQAGLTHDALVRRADVAMYRAKAQGVGGIVPFRSGMSDRARADLEVDLRLAIDNGDIDVHYQPVIDLATEEWIGVEALARWWHPQRGWIAPTTFVAIAEEIGLIGALGDRVLEIAIRQGAAWMRDAKNIRVSVNVSGRQLAEPRFVASVERHLVATGLDPSLLFIELTETTMMEDYDTARAAIASLRALGVNLVIDDFGTGHSTIARLRHFPAVGLKLDQSFVQELGTAPASEGVIAAVVQLAHALELAVVAEGVETAEQLAVLRRLGVDAAQGYLLAKPSDAAAAIATMLVPPAVLATIS